MKTLPVTIDKSRRPKWLPQPPRLPQRQWHQAIDDFVYLPPPLEPPQAVIVPLGRKIHRLLIQPRWPTSNMHQIVPQLIQMPLREDGAIYETLPLLIEAGVDIMNPWQVNCRGMDDTAKFKREFGRDLTIWGGSCDTQKTLPFGTPKEVRDETRRRIEDLAPGGGFVFAPSHVLQGAVPLPNIIAWWETLQEYGVYG